MIAHARRFTSALHPRRPAAVTVGHRQQLGTAPTAARSRKMITETQACVIALQLTDELLARLQPFMAGLDIIATAHGAGASQQVAQHQQRLFMRSEVYEILAE